MIKFRIVETNNENIIKLETDDFLVRGSYQYENIDQAKDSPLAQELFYLPFIKTVYITGTFIALERYSIVKWEDVQEEVKEQIENYINSGKDIITEKNSDTKRQPITIYAESTSNPAVVKFVANKRLVDKIYEFHSIDDAKKSPLAMELFKFPFVKEVFLDNNYVSITKYNITDWDEVIMQTREFIREYIALGKEVIVRQEDEQIAVEDLDEYSKKIVAIIDEYVKPAVANDGGNIKFLGYDEKEDTVRVLLQGACSGCPSSSITLKNGIETLLREMLNSSTIFCVLNFAFLVGVPAKTGLATLPPKPNLCKYIKRVAL